MSFKQFLAEQSNYRLLHLQHPEDTILDGKHAVSFAIQTLKDVNDKLKGIFNDTSVTEKFDGSPSIIFGHNPENKQFFVGTKSVFNKVPKINYTPEDVLKNHPEPGLNSKLLVALKVLPKVTPKEGVYQGDLMYTKDDVSEHDGHFHFTPNTLMYSVPIKSDHGKLMKSAELGLVVHTHYRGPTMQKLVPHFYPNIQAFKKHESVHIINPEIDENMVEGKNATAFDHHIKQAEKHFNGAHVDFLPIVTSTPHHLKTYINSTVRDGSNPSTSGYKKHVMDRSNDEIKDARLSKTKQRKVDAMMSALKYVDDNEEHFDTLFNVHHHIRAAKDALVDSLNGASGWETSVNGKEVPPEGFVATKDGIPVKLVNRAEFSKANFLKHSIPK